MNQTENIWSYKPKKSKKEFSAWLNKFEIPEHDFDYDEAYKNLFDDFTRFFTFEETENWENTYFELLNQNLAPLKPALSSWYDNLDISMKTFYEKEGFNKEEFDDKYSKILGAMSLGEGTYSIASDSFIRNFNDIDGKRFVISKLCQSISKFK